MEKAAWILLVLAALEIIVKPFYFGRKHEYTASGWLCSVIVFVLLYLPICGRIIGWW